jgi:hypothetical protein
MIFSRGSRREAIIAVIREATAGLSRGEILEKMGLKGDKAGEMSVSNALTALGKTNQIRREGGKYPPRRERPIATRGRISATNIVGPASPASSRRNQPGQRSA